jgi:hypothetical protein
MVLATGPPRHGLMRRGLKKLFCISESVQFPRASQGFDFCGNYLFLTVGDFLTFRRSGDSPVKRWSRSMLRASVSQLGGL